MKNVVVRTLSGIVYIAVFVACILYGANSFFGLTLVLTLVGMAEFERMTAARLGTGVDKIGATLTVFTGLLLCVTSWLFITGEMYAASICMPIVVALICSILCRGVTSASPHALSVVAQSILNIVYVALPLALLNIVYSWLPGVEGRTLILVSLVCIWINDTGAFCVGCTIGKRRLCERLSPKKSWEGFWGGLCLTTLAMIGYAYFTEASIGLYAAYGILISILSTIGDLFESLLKRTAGVKDSGNVIPGHGGVLDRIDSFLFVSYAIILLTLIIK